MVEKMLQTCAGGNPLRQASLAAALVMTCLWLLGKHYHANTKAELQAFEEGRHEQDEELQRMRVAGEERRRQLHLANERLLSILQNPSKPNTTFGIAAVTTQEGHQAASSADGARHLQSDCGSCWSHWRIFGGDGCEVSPGDAHCIQSTNYPANYELRTGCFIEIAENPDFWIVFEDYQASPLYSYFKINGEELNYRLNGPPAKLKPKSGPTIQWNTHWLNVRPVRRGFKICRRSTCENYMCGPKHTLKPDPQLILCGADICGAEDLETCCDPLCEAPQDPGSMYDVYDNCTSGQWYSVSDCQVTCADGSALDGFKPPQMCQSDGQFSLPTCALSNSTSSFPWVTYGQCQHYGPGCVSSKGVGGRYKNEENCIVAVDSNGLAMEESQYRMFATYVDTHGSSDRLVLGVRLDADADSVCGSGGWSCGGGGNDIPKYAWSNSLRRISGTAAPQGPFDLSNILWTSDSTSASTGWIMCVQATCVAMSCPPGLRFNCQSEDQWCGSHDCSLNDDVELCCVSETQADADFYDFELGGEARNVSWCWARTTTTTTTTTTPWTSKIDVVGHLVLTLTAVDVDESVLIEVLRAGLQHLAAVDQYDVQVGLNVSNDLEPTSHVAFRVEQTVVPLPQLPSMDFLMAFNNGTKYVEAIVHRVMSSSLTVQSGHPSGKVYRDFGSHCESLHPCGATGSCWMEDETSVTCAQANEEDICGSNMSPGSGWLGIFEAEPNYSYSHWATVLAVQNSGSETILDVCCACGGGRCSSGYFRVFDDAPTFCIACPAGTTSDVQDNPHNCTPCEPGTFSAVQGSSDCSLCPAGRYTDEHGQSECKACDPGTASAVEGVTVCEACPPGENPSDDKVECIKCAAGRFAAFNATPECELCPPGQFIAKEGVTQCALCDIGTFTGGAGRTECDPCNPGSYSDDIGFSACHDCSPGEAQALWQQTACVECEIAYYAGIFGLTECLLCEAGTESPMVGASECTPCEKGYAKEAGVLNCSACMPGTFTSERGLSSCKLCPELGMSTNAAEAADGCVDCMPGRYGDMLGLTSCVECAPGTFSMEEKLTTCIQCGAGSFANESGLTDCLACSPGTFTPNVGQSLCEKCDAGLDAPAFGSLECKPCNAGKYAPVAGTPACMDCKNGSVSPLQGGTACVICKPGRFAALQGQQECELCELGYYADEEGSLGCKSCNPAQPSYWTTMSPPDGNETQRPSGVKPYSELRGASSNLFCGCRPGAQFKNGACEDCGEGLTCLGMGVLEIEEGYAWDRGYSSWNCKHGIEEACPGGIPGTCKPGRDEYGVACAACLPDMVEQQDGSCSKCNAGEPILPVLAAVVAFGFCTALYYMFDSPKRARPKLAYLLIVASLGQAVTIVQQLGIISLIRVDWADPMLDALELVATLAFFDLQDIRTGCVLNLDIPGQYFLRVFTVFIALTVVCIAHLISQVVQHRHDWNSRWPSLWCALGTIMLACMVSIVSTMLAPMQCRRHPNERQTISWYPSIVCWEGGDHSTMVGLGSAACILPAVFLAGSFWAVWKYPKRLMQARTTFINGWAFLFFRYTPEAYWYGPIMMVRNCLIATVPVLTSPVLQIVGLEVVMLASLVSLLYVMPWRVPRANDLDAVGHLCLLFVAMLASFFIGKEDLNFVSVVAVILICVLPFLVLVLIGYGLWVLVRSSRREFQFFLCHHKQGAGCFCRLLKMWLLQTSGVSRKVFIDSDDLKNLDKLFDIVAHQTTTLVAVASSQLLQRPWCVGEITTAHRSRVRITPLYVSGVEPPTDDFIMNFDTYVPEVASIAQFGIDLPMVQEALRMFKVLNKCQLPQEIADKTLEMLCSGLASSKLNLPEQLVTGMRMPTNVPEVVIIANKMDFEAAATAMILRNLLNPLIQHQGTSLSYVLGMGDMVSPTVKKAMLICSNGVFTDHVLRALLTCKAKSAVLLPIMSVTNFVFPSQEWMDRQETFNNLTTSERDEVCGVVRGVFSEIAVDFQPSALSGTEATLHTKAEEIAIRLVGHMSSLTDKVNSLSKRSKQASTSQLTVSSHPSGRSSGIVPVTSQNSGKSGVVQVASQVSGKQSLHSAASKREVEIIAADWELGGDM